MSAITPEELKFLEQASAKADAVVADLLKQERDSGNFGPKLKVGGDIGDYVIPPVLSWETLYAVVKDHSYDIDYSLQKYPAFDGLVDENFNSDEFVNPLNKRYEKWADLRDNIACVRNYLMIYYFAQNPKNMSEQAAEDAMEDIAKFIGRGCYNNFLFLGLIPNHNPLEDFIDIEKASAPGGDGARYIYERILAKNRSSSWLKPFSEVIDFFSGSSVKDWQIPPTNQTPFDPYYSELLIDEALSVDAVDAAIDEANRLRDLLASTREHFHAQLQLQRQSNDLDALGNQLLFSAASAHHVVGLKEPVRRDAVEIAKDILRKLKVSIGDINVKDGLRLNPDDDVAAIGAIKGVMGVFEKMLSHARSVDASVLNHPAVISATQAFGQIGYLAKLEAFRFASKLGDTTTAQMIKDQLQRIPDFYATSAHPKLGDLIERIEVGMDVVLSRLQQISGPASLLSKDMHDTVGTSMDTASAGLQNHIASAIGVQSNQNAQLAQQAADLAARTQAARLLAEQARKDGKTANAAPSIAVGAGRGALSEARSASRNQSQTQRPSAISGIARSMDTRTVRPPAAVAQPAQNARPTPLPQPAAPTTSAAIPPHILAAMQKAQLNMQGIQAGSQQNVGMSGPAIKPPKTPNAKADSARKAAEQAAKEAKATDASRIQEEEKRRAAARARERQAPSR